MKNKIFAFLAVVVLCLTMILTVSASDTFIYGETSFFGDVSELDKCAQAIEDTYDYSVFIAVVESTGDKDTYEYGKDIFENNAVRDDGLVLVYDYGENVYNFYLAGEAESIFTNDILKNKLWYAFANNESYFTCSVNFYKEVEAVLTENAGAASSEPDADTVTDAVTVPEADTAEKADLVVDNADVLTDEEESAFAAKLADLGEKYELEIVILTVDSYEGRDPQAFADDYYDYNGYGYGDTDNGYIVVFNTGKLDGNRNLAISACGTASDRLSDTDTDVIIEMMINPIKQDDFAGAFDIFISESDSSLKRTISVFWIPVSILIGFALAYIIVKIQASKLKSVAQKEDAAEYVGDIMLTAEYDNFLYMDVRKDAKPKDNSSSDNSSSHTSSSGKTHTGTNKSF